MATSTFIRLIRPKSFLHFISLPTATEFISLTILINKASGFYGLLALFTGYHLSALQLSMYIYSILIFSLISFLASSIRRRKAPLRNLCLAWIMMLDTLINAGTTIVFGMGWFILLAQNLTPGNTGSSNGIGAIPGGKMINDTAGFTSPKAGKVDEVHVIAKPAGKGKMVQDAVAIGLPASGKNTGLGHVVFDSGSIMSLGILSLLWMVRVYFVIIVMSHARTCLRRSIAASTVNNGGSESAVATRNGESRLLKSPFEKGQSNGQGWQGALGRLLVLFPKTYWLGIERDDDHVKAIKARERFRDRSTPRKVPRTPEHQTGTVERERRARSGTGPPIPAPKLSDIKRTSTENRTD